MKIISRSASVLLGIAAAILFVVALCAPPETESGRTLKQPLSGKAASDYLVQTRDGQSLMEALTVARFGLQWQEHAPGESKSEGGGYLGLSHEQNLNAWFDADGVTVRLHR